MPSNRFSAVHVLILAALPLAGCGDSRDASWPAGTEAVVSAPEARDIIAHVPKDQQNKIPRDALVLTSQTPVVIVDDSLSRAVKERRWWGTSPTDPVRVRVAKGHQGIEVFVRRRELTPGARCWRVGDFPPTSRRAALIRRGWGFVDGRDSRAVILENPLALGPDGASPRIAAPADARDHPLAGSTTISTDRAHRRGL